jgi:hypothetical protein
MNTIFFYHPSWKKNLLHKSPIHVAKNTHLEKMQQLSLYGSLNWCIYILKNYVYILQFKKPQSEQAKCEWANRAPPRFLL